MKSKLLLLIFSFCLLFSISSEASVKKKPVPKKKVTHQIIKVKNTNQAVSLTKAHLNKIHFVFSPADRITFEMMEGNNYVVHVYQYVIDHTDTYNWYYVNKYTEKVTPLFIEYPN